MTESHASIRQWSSQIALGVFLAYTIYGCYVSWPLDAGDLLHVAFRALLASWLALGTALIFLAILTHFPHN